MSERPFCPDQLWDSNLTWYTDNPEFTVCFHETVLVYIPSAVLLLLSPLQVRIAQLSKDRNVPWSLLNIIRLTFTVLLVVFSLIDLGYAVNSFSGGRDIPSSHPVFIVASVVKIVTFALVFYLQYLNKKHGIVSSGILLFYWTTAAITGAITFRSVATSSGIADGQLPFVTSALEYSFVLAIWFLSCWADPKPTEIHLEDQADDLAPEKYASALSRLLFCWLDPLIWKGRKKLLGRIDLWTLMNDNRTTAIVPNWDFNWQKENNKKKSTNKPMSVLPVMIRSFGPPYFLAVVLTLLLSVLQFASPQIVNLLINFVQSDEPNWKGYFYTVLIVCVTFTCTLLNAQAFYREYLVGLRIRSALISAIYRKSLKLSNTSRKLMTVGETTNLMQIDSQKFMDLALYLNLFWSSPLQIILALYFLWGVLGPAALAGLAVMILMIPLNGIVAKKLKKYQLSQMKSKDQRTKTMDEVLNGMKIIKLYAWELSFKDKVSGIRDTEIGALKKAAYLNAIMTFLWVCAPVVVALASFATYVLIDENNVLDANTAFVSLTLFNLLRFPLNVLPILLVYLIQCQVSLKRINRYMNSEELDPTAVTHDDSKDAVMVDNGTFTWDKGSKPSLSDINLAVKQGELVAVVGPVGSGKSSLLSALLGEMEKVSGVVNTKGRVAYVPQQAWIQNATVQYNIVFGKSYDKRRYNKVLESCALLPDLKVLPGGDQTEIGEKGINLSGGQKQRISMARSVYNDGQLYLLDDPLSAVDAHVGAHIFDQVIGPRGILKNKTRVLVTHSVKFLPKMDKIFVMKDGRISEQGTYQQLLEAKGEFADFLIEYLAEEEEGSDAEDLENLKQSLESVLGKEKFERQLSQARSIHSLGSSRISTRSPTVRRRQRLESQMTSLSAADSTATNKVKQPGHTLIEEEKMEIGGVKWEIYFYYIKSIGGLMVLSTILLYLAFTGCSVGSSIWLSEWSTDIEASTDVGTRNLYLTVYGLLGFFQAVFIMVGTVVLSVGTLNAATKLHGSMLERILRSPMSFFDTTPLGRILNRFSKDIDIVDVTLPMILRGLVNNLLAVLGTIIIIIFSNVLFVAVIIPVGVLFYILQRVYIATARQVKRLESISRSPIYSHFGETISGAVTIRAYKMTGHFIKENERKIDYNQIFYYPTFVSSRWLAVRLENLGNLIVFFASLFAVLTRDWMDPGLVGLALSNALTVTNAMSYLVSMASEIETNMVGVERIKEYQDIREEAPLLMPEQDPPPEWPEHGVVKFENYQTRYREGLDLVLKGIDCNIRSGEKVGIVGRTGAGKSSLTLALFRIIESAGGSITIDGQNIGLMGLYRLRSRLTIIPQEPVLFSGSLRSNLDPFGQHSDGEIWVALEQAHLKSYVSNLTGNLNFEVNEGGENLSVGQRQLVCLARALLRKTKVLVLDEATAAVDLETDDLIQDTIRKEFSDCTVLTIAHRLNTIMDSSKVMVLDSGKIVEYDSPSALLDNPNGVFYSMAKEAGLVGGNQESTIRGNKLVDIE